MTRVRLVLSLAVLAFAVLSPSRAEACSCGSPRSTLLHFEHSDLVFVGSVARLDQVENGYETSTVLRMRLVVESEETFLAGEIKNPRTSNPEPEPGTPEPEPRLPRALGGQAGTRHPGTSSRSKTNGRPAGV
jgi:hypothetical protein